MIFISILIFIMAIAIPSLKRQLSSLLLSRITTIILLYSGVLSFNALYIQSIGSGIGIYSGLFHISNVSQLLDTFILIIGALILIPRPNIIKPNYNLIMSSYTQEKGVVSASTPALQNTMQRLLINPYTIETPSLLGMKYSLIVLFTTLGSILLVSSADLISMYLSIELQSFGVYILTTLFRDNKLATSAGLKYFLLGGFSSCLILLGSALVYSYTGLTNLNNIYMLTSVSSLMESNGNTLLGFTILNQLSAMQTGLLLGVSIIMVGYLFKISAAPLHNWAPDVYDDSPTIITIWLTIMPKISILMFILDLYLGSTLSLQINGFINQFNILGNLLLVTSLLSLIIGTIVGLAQTKIKRLLAYSTISHIGFILLALSITSEQSIESFIFYVIVYTLTNLNTFLILLALGYLIKTKSSYFSINENIESKDIKYINELKGQFNSNPLLSISLAICLFSMAGVPPLLGFFSKQMVLYSAIGNGYIFMSIVAILTSVISASYYLKIVRILFTTQDNNSSSLDSNVISNDNNNTLTLFKNSYSTALQTHPYISNISILTNAHSFLISTLTLSILLFIFKPSIILNSCQLLSLSIFNC